MAQVQGDREEDDFLWELSAPETVHPSAYVGQEPKLATEPRGAHHWGHRLADLARDVHCARYDDGKYGRVGGDFCAEIGPEFSKIPVRPNDAVAPGQGGAYGVVTDGKGGRARVAGQRCTQ
jgi:hypothetical protein